MTTHSDPKLLYSVNGIRAYHIQNGEERSLTPSHAQTLSLLMVPTAAKDTAHDAEEDFYLHLNLPPDLDISLPATTQICHQPPRSYLIPRWDLGSESRAFTRVEFPPLGSGPSEVTQDDIDTFETILAQCTAFLDCARDPELSNSAKKYNPMDYAPGEGYAAGTGQTHTGRIVLVDEDNGKVAGELVEGATIVEDPKLKPGSKNPVEIQISEDGSFISVRPASEEYLELARHPVYKNSSLVQNAAVVSRLMVTSSNYIGGALIRGAGNFTEKTKPNPKPMTFKPTTHQHVRKINSMTHDAAGMSSKTIGQASKYAQNLGAAITRRGERRQKGFDKEGKAIEDYKPGLLNKSMIAFSTITDGIAQSGSSLLATSGTAAAKVVNHRYGSEAGSIASDMASGITNVGLVYIDVMGVSRRAVIKSVAKGMVVGSVKGGGKVVVGSANGVRTPEKKKEMKKI